MKKKIAFAMIMGVVTTAIVSFTLIAINVGFTTSFINVWLKSWGIAYIIAIPAILIIAPRIEQLVNKIFAAQEAVNKQDKL